MRKLDVRDIGVYMLGTAIILGGIFLGHYGFGDWVAAKEHPQYKLQYFLYEDWRAFLGMVTATIALWLLFLNSFRKHLEASLVIVFIGSLFFADKLANGILIFAKTDGITNPSRLVTSWPTVDAYLHDPLKGYLWISFTLIILLFTGYGYYYLYKQGWRKRYFQRLS